MKRLSPILSTFLKSNDPFYGMIVFQLMNKTVRGVEMNIPVKIDQVLIMSEFVDIINNNETENIKYLFTDFAWDNNINVYDPNLEISVNYIINTLNR